MADRLIATSSTAGLRQLGLHGEAVIAAHRQLAAILSSRLGPGHAALLSVPRIDPGGQRIDWYSDLPGPVRRVADLPEAEQAPLRAEAERLSSEIAALGESLAAAGGAGEMAGRMLALALRVPGPAHLYAVGDRPVLTQWGHQAEGVAAAPVLPLKTPPPPLASGPALAAPAGGGRGIRGWPFWLLPLLLLLLLAFLALRACEPLPPVVVEVQDPNPPPPPPDPVPELEARLAELQAERDTLARERQARLELCVPEEPEPPQRVEDLPQEVVPAPVPRPQIVEAPPEPAPAPPPPREPRPEPQPQPVPERPPQVASPQPAPAPGRSPCVPSYLPGDEPEVVLVVDGSNSMNEPFAGGTSRIEQARSSIRNMVSGLPPGVDVGLIDFRGCENVRRDRFYSDSERGQLIGEVQRLQPWGGTALARSIERAGNVVSNDVDSVIVVVSDGEESCHGDPCAAARALKASKPNAVVNVIDISGNAKGRQTVECVARATGGRVLTPQSPMDFARQMQQASGQPDIRACGG